MPATCFVLQHLHVVQAAPAAQSTPLQVSQHLSSSGGTAVHEVAWLQKELAAASEHAEAREAAWADRLRQMQAELRRCVHGCCWCLQLVKRHTPSQSHQTAQDLHSVFGALLGRCVMND
jgi:hypothetical protein